jgi:hypothetical protein
MTILNTILIVANKAPQLNNEIDYKLLMTLLSSLFGAVIGGGITIWHKRKEINNLTKSIELQSKGLELQSQNLELQTKLFEETKINNELKIKAELVRLEDLNRQYKLSLQKYDFEHLSKVLDFGNDKDEKVAMMREFVEKLSKYNPQVPDWIEEYSEYQEYIVNHIYFSLDEIRNDIETLLKNNVSTFVILHTNFNKVISDINNIKRQISQYTMNIDDIDKDTIIAVFFDSLFSLHEDYNNLLELMKEEFKELGKIKRDYIRSQFDTRTQE